MHVNMRPACCCSNREGMREGSRHSSQSALGIPRRRPSGSTSYPQRFRRPALEPTGATPGRDLGWVRPEKVFPNPAPADGRQPTRSTNQLNQPRHRRKRVPSSSFKSARVFAVDATPRFRLRRRREHGQMERARHRPRPLSHRQG